MVAPERLREGGAAEVEGAVMPELCHLFCAGETPGEILDQPHIQFRRAIFKSRLKL